MAKSGIAEEIIVARIKRNARPFDINSAEISELQKSGVSETVVKFLIDPSLPYTPPAPPAPSNAAAGAQGGPNASIAPAPSPAKPPLDPLVLKLPPEPGLYWFNDADPKGQPIQLELKPIVASKQKGKSKLLLGLNKGTNIGSLAGAASKVRLTGLAAPGSGANLFARVMTPIEDLVLVKLENEEGRRDLSFGPKAAKPTFPPKSVRQFESKDVGQGVIRLTLPPLEQGEYLLFILGSGEEKKGTLGKGWEFGAQ